VIGLVTEAARRALDDAGLSAADVDGFTSEAQTTLGRARTDELAVAIGAPGRRLSAHTSIVGSGVVGALQLAQLAIEVGLADVVLSYYGISLSVTDGGPYHIHAEDPPRPASRCPSATSASRCTSRRWPSGMPTSTASPPNSWPPYPSPPGPSPSAPRRRSCRHRSTSTATSPIASWPTPSGGSTAASSTTPPPRSC
jgi:hypothetical protein